VVIYHIAASRRGARHDRQGVSDAARLLDGRPLWVKPAAPTGISKIRAFPLTLSRSRATSPTTAARAPIVWGTDWRIQLASACPTWGQAGRRDRRDAPPRRPPAHAVDTRRSCSDLEKLRSAEGGQGSGRAVAAWAKSQSQVGLPDLRILDADLGKPGSAHHPPTPRLCPRVWKRAGDFAHLYYNYGLDLRSNGSETNNQSRESDFSAYSVRRPRSSAPRSGRRPRAAFRPGTPKAYIFT